MISATRAQRCSSRRARTRKRSRSTSAIPPSAWTFDRYGHLLPSLDERLRDGLDYAFRQAQDGTGVTSDTGQHQPDTFAIA